MTYRSDIKLKIASAFQFHLQTRQKELTKKNIFTLFALLNKNLFCKVSNEIQGKNAKIDSVPVSPVLFSSL